MPIQHTFCSLFGCYSHKEETKYPKEEEKDHNRNNTWNQPIVNYKTNNDEFIMLMLMKDKRYSKEICPLVFQLDIFELKRYLDRGRVDYLTKEEFLCKLCHKGFKTNNTLKQHEIAFHYDAYHCKKCAYHTKSKYLLIEHTRKKHETPGNYSREALQLVQGAVQRGQQQASKGDMELTSQLTVQMEKMDEHGAPEESIKDSIRIEDIKYDLEENVSKKIHCGECAGCTRDPCGNCPSCLDLAKVISGCQFHSFFICIFNEVINCTFRSYVYSSVGRER